MARIAGILHLAEHGAPGLREPVTAQNVLAASQIGDYFKAAAIKVFAEMAPTAAPQTRSTCFERIRQLGQG